VVFMKVGEIWVYRVDGCRAIITCLYHEDGLDWVVVDPVNGDPEDVFPDYIRDEFIQYFTKEY